MASLAYYLVLFLYLHACTARVLLLESDKQAHDDHSQPPSKVRFMNFSCIIHSNYMI